MKTKGVFLKTKGKFSTAATSKIELFAAIVHGCHQLITIVTTTSILDVKAALDPPMYPDTLYNFLLVLQILINL